MENGKQILDVSYGKFSCRLEGFDDSVETMKLVVGYFHELAGHDQFMDMEQQAPDMDTLRELTEEHADSDVSITEEDGKISLTVEDAAKEVVEDAPAEDLGADDLVADDTEEAMAETEDDLPDDDLMDDDSAFAGDAEEDIDEFDDVAAASEVEEEIDPLDEGASVADKLQHIRSVVSGAHSFEGDATDAAEDAADDLAEVEDEVAEELNDAFSDRLAALSGSDDVEEVAEETEEMSEVSEDEMAAEMDADEAEDAFEDELAALDDEEELTAKETAEEDQAPFEDEESVDLMAELAAQEETVAEEMSDEAGETDQEEAVAGYDESDMSEDALDDAIAEDAEDAIKSEAPETEKVTEDLTEDVAEALSEADNGDIFEEELHTTADMSEDMSEAAAALEVEMEEGEPGDDAAISEEPEVAEEDAKKPFLLTPNLAAPAKNTTGDEEFDLAKEVAKVEAEIAARPGNEVARHGLPRSVEDAMSRILSQTDQQLNAPESKRHRDAFAQLKAAVAATEAARQLGEKSKIVDPEGAFKDDLGAHDAEGKSLGLSSDTTENGSDDNVTPLKLVATQAIENANAAASDQLDPASEKLRRIAALKERDLKGVKKLSFAEFASQQGATDVIDMLEAAAAYITFIEGDPDFTRPQVMKVVQSASAKEITREEGLRSFGRLLRQARFIKLNNGRFQVAENTAFRPDDDWAAQG